MAKKGNMNVNKDDFDFDDEMFPLDDSVYDDDDDLAGFSFDPNAEGPTGVKGFFVNTIKSVKGLGLDFVDEFLPEVSSLTDDVKMALSESKDQFVEKKDKAISALADLKSSFGSKINKESKDSAKKGFKNIADNIKKGKFYTSNRDKPIDMNAFLGDDDLDDGDTQEEQDTSGVMTTKFNYKMPRKRVVNNIVVNNGNDAQLYADVQEAATATISSTNMRIAKAQITNTNQNFYESINILKSIDNNLYGLSKFLTHYGKTNIDAQLEFDSKTLAFLTDQRALLKDILKTNRLSVGIKEKDENEEEKESSLFGLGGNLDLGKYTNLIKENAKNMFMGTQLGQVIDMGSGMAGMFGKGGIKLNPSDIASSMIKSFVFNQLIGSKTKNKLDRLNNLYGNVGGALTATANRWKDSDNGVLSFLGELMGTEKGINKQINLNKENLQDNAVFDVMTKETINETIPGYLSQILSAITGNKLTYYNHQSKQFEERDSIEKKYKQVQEDAIGSNFKFTSAINRITDSVREKNRDFTQGEINKAIDKFRDNLIESKSALDPFKLTHRKGNEEYVNKMFRGFESIVSKDKVESLKNLISTQITTLKPEEIADMNTSITKVANDVEVSSKQFKEQMAKIGGLTAVAELNDKEKWEENDYNKKYSSFYNSALVKNNEFAKRRADMNLLQLQKSEFGERVGKINLNDYQKEMSSTAVGKVNEIYELLLNGIKVYPSDDKEGLDTIYKLNSKLLSNKKNKKAKEQKEIDDENRLRSLSSDARLEEERTRKINEQSLRFKANDNSLIGQLREAIGMDRLVDKMVDIFEVPLNSIYGKNAVKNLVNDGSFDNELLSEAEQVAANRKKELSDLISNQKEKYKLKKSNKKSKNAFDKIGDGISNIGQHVKDFSDKQSAKLRLSNSKKALKRSKKQDAINKEIEKHGTFKRQMLLKAGGDDKLIELHNLNLESSGIGKSKVFVDSTWLSSLKDDSEIKHAFYNAAMNHNAFITTNPFDDNIDVAFFVPKNLSDDEKKSLSDRSINQIVANKKDISILNKALLGYSAKKSIEIGNRSNIIDNLDISDYNDRDNELNKQSVVKFDFNARKTNDVKDYSLDVDVSNAKSKYNEYNKKYNKDSSAYKKLSDERKKKIEAEREKLLKKVNDAISKRDSFQSKDLGFRYKYINKINSSKDAGLMFLKPGTQKEIDELLFSNDKEAIYKFANKIKSKNEKIFTKEDELINNLDPKFRSRVQSFMNDPELMGYGVKIKESVRSPLFQFALYSKGRTDPSITEDLMRAAGCIDGLNYFPKEIRTKMGPDGITVRSLASNHLTGRSIDINNGSLSWNKIAKIASFYGIKWAGNNDRPHFEFDEKWNGKIRPIGVGPLTESDSKNYYSYNTSKLPSNGSMLEKKRFDNNYNAELKVSGKPLSYFQNDPIDTKVSGKPIENISKQFKSNRDILEAIYSNTERIANNIETVGFRFGIPGKLGSGLIGKIGDTAKSLGSKLIDGTKFVAGKAYEVGSSLVSKGVDIAKNGYNKFLDFKDEKYKKLVGKATNFLLENKFITKKELKKMDDSEILKTAIKFGFNASFISSLISKGKELGGNLYNKAKDFILGTKDDIVEKAADYLLKNKIISKRRLNKMSDKEIIKLALENGFKESKDKVGGLISKISSRISDGVSKGKELGSGLFNKAKDFILSKKESTYEKAKEFLLNAKLITQKELDKLPEKEVIALAIKNGFEDTKGRVGGLFSNLRNKFTNGIGSGGSLISFGGGIKNVGSILSKMDEIIKAIYIANDKTPPNIENTTNIKPKTNLLSINKNIDEGSYEDQKSDKERKEEKQHRFSIAKNIAAIAATLGTTQSIAATGKESVQPENNIASLLKANYENAEKQNDLLENINENSAKAAKNAGGGKWGGLGTFGGKLAKGINTAGSVATIGAAAAGAVMLAKQGINKVKTMKQDAAHSTKLEKFGSLFGAGGAGNYDAEGNEIDNSGKAGRSFGVNQLVHVGTFAKGVSKIGGLFGKFSGFVSKIFSNPKIIAKIGGKEAAANVSKAFLKEMGKATAKPGILAKISGKISSFCAKVSQPIGWGVMIAQLVYDIGTGMAEANRYFSMGKGMKPTFAMRITAGLAKALSGNLTFGLIPPATIANFVFNIIGKDSTKKQMEEAKEFDTKRAAIMEVEYKRLVEFETMTWSEILFGQDKKRATILGFLKFDKKHPEKNKDSIAKFKNWFEKVYKPLDQMYRDMVKQYGGKVDKKIDPDDIAAMENRDKFRKDYLDAAKKYMSSNRLYGLGPLGKENLNPSENNLLKDEEKNNENIAKKEDEQLQKISEESSAELSAEGIDVKNASNASPSLSAKLPETNSKDAENAQADGVNLKKIIANKGYVNQWKQYAKDNIQKTRLYTAAQNARAGIIGSVKKTKIGAALSAGFKKVKKIASSLIGGAKEKLGTLFKTIKSPADAIASFVTRRKESEAELSTMFNDKNDQSVLNLADKIADKRALGQQRSAANLSPEFAQRVEAFLKDPRVMNHGVTIREGYRSPLTQLAYFSKGRADNSITDKLMKKAGFKNGINFWAKSFQKPGDYITWTLASNHFNGTAVDLEPGDLGYDKLGSIAAEYGIDWGGNWSTPDKPHFEMGDPNFKLNKAVASSSTSVGEAQQADTINYDRMLNYANKAKEQLSNTVGYVSKASKNGILNHLSGKKLISTTTSKLAYKAKDVYNKAKSSMSASLNKDESIINSNLIVSKFDDLLKLSSEGVDIMRNLYDETMRHNKKEEEMLGNLIKGIAGLGALMAAAQNGGYSSAGSSNSITKGIFDSLAKGI